MNKKIKIILGALLMVLAVLLAVVVYLVSITNNEKKDIFRINHRELQNEEINQVEKNAIQDKQLQTKDIDPLAYSVSLESIVTTKNKIPFDYSVEKLLQMSKDCNKNKTKEYFSKLVDRFEKSSEFVYEFKASDGDGAVFVVKILPNKMNYNTLDEFKNDFDQCYAGGDAYPEMMNKNWLLFVSSCGTGVYSNLTKECEEIKKKVIPTLKLK